MVGVTRNTSVPFSAPPVRAPGTRAHSPQAEGRACGSAARCQDRRSELSSVGSICLSLARRRRVRPKGGGGGVFERRPYGVESSRKITVDLGIPESQNTVSGIRQTCVASLVVKPLTVMPVTADIDFNDQSAFEADEIEQVALAGRLPAKMVSVRAPGSKVRPKCHFLPRHMLAKIASSLVRHGRRPTELALHERSYQCPS